MYTFKTKVRYSECDETGRLSLTAIVNYFQDCCTFQSDELGVGWDALQQINKAWLLNSWHIIVDERPTMNQEIIVGTWPSGFKGFYGTRNFLLQDGDGRVLAYANSLWVFVDTQTGHPSRVPEEIVSRYTQEPPYPMKEVSRKIPVPVELTTLPSFPATPSYIDTNRHVNNGGYVRMASDYLPKDFDCKQLRVEYRNAAVEGDLIQPSRSLTEDTCTIVLAAEDNKPFAIVEYSTI